MPAELKTDTERLQDAMEIIRKKNTEITSQKQTIANLHRENDTAEFIRQRIYSLSARDPEPPEWLTRKSVGNITRGCPITIWSDWHWGEVVSSEEVAGVNEFNAKIAKKRVGALVDSTIDVAWNHMGTYKSSYPGMVVALGGDMLTGNIHEELADTNDRTPQESIEDLTDILCSALDNMATKFGKLFVPCVVGNHGRSTKAVRFKQRVYTSYEWNIYCNMARYFRKSSNIRFLIPGETDAYFSVFGHRYLLTHGDSLGVKGGDGIIGAVGPVIRGAIKVGRSEAQIGRDFDTIIMGHWHQYLTFPGIIVNNCLIGYNEYARASLRAPYSRPSQALWFTHPKHGITAHWQIYLEDQKTTQDEKNWVSWQQ